MLQLILHQVILEEELHLVEWENNHNQSIQAHF
jgi:hypothetical protein